MVDVFLNAVNIKHHISVAIIVFYSRGLYNQQPATEHLVHFQLWTMHHGCWASAFVLPPFLEKLFLELEIALEQELFFFYLE